MSVIIGREYEVGILERAYNSENPEFIALYGRRRVGKTYLIKNSFKNKKNAVFFSVTGIKEGNKQRQIKNFLNRVALCFNRPGLRLEKLDNWFDVFDFLVEEIKLSKKKKIVLFFDEFPWMVTRRSELLMALESFWNQYASDDPRIKLIVCGSSAGWIIKKIVNNRGALYNRITRRIALEPFNLYETKNFLMHNKVRLTDKQITHLYMVLGGIPFYLSKIEPGFSSIQAISELAFRKNSFMLDEFSNLYATLFGESGGHIELARIIAGHRYGIGQVALAKKAASITSTGGTLVKWLKDLEYAGFIQRFQPYSTNKKGVYYKMVDEYSLFYFHWIEPIKETLQEKGMTKTYWERLQHSSSWNSWAGYAFESLCHKHTFQIMKALGVSDTSIPYTWRYIPPRGAIEQGAQIDLLFDRDDGLISVCEIKYTRDPFVITKDYAVKLGYKLKVFEEHTKTKKTLILSMVSASGLKKNFYSEQMVLGVCTLHDLFKESE